MLITKSEVVLVPEELRDMGEDSRRYVEVCGQFHTPATILPTSVRQQMAATQRRPRHPNTVL
jgi:hypothetical protein